MMNINLLPWREQLREEKKREFLILLAGAVVGSVLLIFLILLILTGQVRGQVAANRYIQDETVILDAQTEQIKELKQDKIELIERMKLIQNLQAERTSTVHLFDEMVRIAPTGVFLTEVQRTGDVVLLTGKADSNSRVSALMRNIEKSTWLDNPVLTQIKTNEDDDDGLARDFQVEMDILLAAKASDHNSATDTTDETQ